jgi:tetratricopeptide (TPR) repeat protein
MGNRKAVSKIRNFAFALMAIFLGTAIEQAFEPSVILAQTPQPNPLESPTRDPLLPPIDRPLSPLETLKLKEELDGLNALANAQFQAGNIDEAFAIWYRELRLRRILGRLEEVPALGRVGEVAWNKDRTADLLIITQRLRAIHQQAEVEAPLDPALLNALAQAYLQVQSIDPALDIHQKILVNARKTNDINAQETTLQMIGQLQLARFDYSQAAATFEELLLLARSQLNTYNEGLYLQKLAEIYHQSLQPENALRIKEQLVNHYLANQKIQALPVLKISIGDDYAAIKQPEKASQNYQEAFSLAWALQQLGAAGEALTKLGDLYLAYNQSDYALKIYQELLKVEQQSYNYYGLMNTYDRMGKIYQEQKHYSQALFVFQKALEIAKSLSYQESYFLTQIEEVNKQKSLR